MMTKQECGRCERLYCEGYRITTDWAYWERTLTSLTCPKCRGIDVAAEMERTIAAMTRGN